MKNKPSGIHLRRPSRIAPPVNEIHRRDLGPKQVPILWQTHLWTKPIHAVTQPHPMIGPADILHLQTTGPRDLSMKRNERNGSAAALGSEVTLRVVDLQPMKRFYQDFLGFELMGEFPNAALLEITSSDGKTVQAIGLLKRTANGVPKHHAGIRIVVSFTPDEYMITQRRLEHFGIRLDKKTDNRIRIQDPEGNRVELVCRHKGGGRRTGRRRDYR
ncbi:MAG TPA: VOC family protein [Candidatus Acidoferrales bacterium]|nr:VOC family protein [Candidatus Acidoferrales bacterium]